MTILFPGVQESTVLSTSIKNSAAASLAVPSVPQSIVTTGITYLTGSKLGVPNGGLTLGALLAADFEVAKSGSGGTETAIINVLAGQNGDVTDTVVATLNKPVATAGAGNAVFNVKSRFVGQYATSQVPYLGNSSLSIINDQATTGVVALGSFVTSQVAALTTTQIAALSTAKYIGLAVTFSAATTYQINQLDTQLSGLSTGAPNQ